MSSGREPTERLHAVLVTFERPRDLATMVRVLAEGSERLDSLVIVDNSRLPQGEPEGATDAAHRVLVIETHENLGPAGGIAVGMDRILATARDDDWILVLDDDDPPPTPESVASLRRFANACADDDPAVGGVGANGGRFDPKTGEIRRVPDVELHGQVDVDYLPGGALPLYRARCRPRRRVRRWPSCSSATTIWSTGSGSGLPVTASSRTATSGATIGNEVLGSASARPCAPRCHQLGMAALLLPPEPDRHPASPFPPLARGPGIGHHARQASVRRARWSPTRRRPRPQHPRRRRRLDWTPRTNGRASVTSQARRGSAPPAANSLG